MGLIQEVQALNKQNTQEQEKLQKKVDALTKKLERAEQLKEYQKDEFKAVENDLKNCFSSCFDKEGLKAGSINLHLKATRDEILKNIPETTLEYDFIDKNYEKILAQVQKIYENDAKAKEKILQAKLAEDLQQELEKKKEEEEKNKRKWWQILFIILGKIFKYTIGIVFVIIYSIFKIISLIAKKY